MKVGPLALLLPDEREPAITTSITGTGLTHALAACQWGTAGVPLGSLDGSVEDMEEEIGYMPSAP